MSLHGSRAPGSISSRFMVTGWPPSCTTAISHEWRVRSDGFAKYSATPLPASGVSEVVLLGAIEHVGELVRRQVVDLEEVPHGDSAREHLAEDRDRFVDLGCR